MELGHGQVIASIVFVGCNYSFMKLGMDVITYARPNSS